MIIQRKRHEKKCVYSFRHSVHFLWRHSHICWGSRGGGSSGSNSGSRRKKNKKTRLMKKKKKKKTEKKKESSGGGEIERETAREKSKRGLWYATWEQRLRLMSRVTQYNMPYTYIYLYVFLISSAASQMLKKKRRAECAREGPSLRLVSLLIWRQFPSHTSL